MVVSSAVFYGVVRISFAAAAAVAWSSTVICPRDSLILEKKMLSRFLCEQSIRKAGVGGGGGGAEAECMVGGESILGRELLFFIYVKIVRVPPFCMCLYVKSSAGAWVINAA